MRYGNIAVENFIKKISGAAAAIAVFFVAGSFYLTLKGFVYDEGKGFVLPEAYAAEKNEVQKDMPLNYAFQKEYVLGNKNAKVTIYEYSSFGCPHCADMHTEVLPDIIKKYVDTGVVKLVFVPLPLDKNSMDAALLAECVAKNKYFDFVSVLFKKQRDWALAFEPQKVLRQYAALSGVSAEKAAVCLKDDKTAARILGDRKAGLTDLGIQGAPTFIIVSPKQIETLSGWQKLEDFSAVIDRHLGKVYNSAVE